MKLVVGVVLGIVLVLLFKAAGGEPMPGPQRSYTRTPTPQLIQRADPRVVDGDTIVLNRTTHRLWGIDAPELGQVCKDKWPAGEKARGFLRLLIEGQTISCDNRGTDKYGRTLSVCSTADGMNLNQSMVLTGNAWAYSQYSREYVLDEIRARQAKAGLWTHNCLPAWEWRHQQPGNSGR